MSSAASSVANRDGQAKFALSRVTSVEKYYGLFCDTLGSMIRKSARLRDKGDLFAHHLKEYAEAEKINNSTKFNLLSFAENFSTIQDYRDTEVQRLEAKVLKPLMRYGELCKNMKSCVKGNQSAWDREKKQMAKLEKLQQKHPTSSPQVRPRYVLYAENNWKGSSQAQNDLHRLRQETGVYGEQLISDTDHFEKNKLTDIKDVLIEFVQIEMMFHARALKYLSKCFDAAQRIDTDADMDQFHAALLEASGLARSFTQTASSMTTGHSTTMASGTLSSSRGSNLAAPAYPQPAPRTHMYETDDDDSDDDYDDDEDDY